MGSIGIIALAGCMFFYHFAYSFLFKSYIKSDKKPAPLPEVLLKGVTALLFLGVLAYFYITTIYYIPSVYEAYACLDTGGSKCYKVLADYDTDSDGGGNSTTYLNKIYFSNGGYITFEYCSENTCWAEDEKGEAWEIDKRRRAWVRKLPPTSDNFR